MCGLVAEMAYSDGAVDRAELIRIRDAMTPRGPDGAGVWLSSDSRAGLAHRRLSLIDLSEAGAQPMSNQDGSLRIVFNGEIYNYKELRIWLEGKGFEFRSGTDTEVLLHLYTQVGERIVERLRGMYAFVIWDERCQRMFAARDPLGIKPLYYADDGAILRVASQVKSLLSSSEVDSKLDSAGQVGFLLLGYVPDPHTIYRGIRALPAGAYLIAERNSRPSIHHFCRIEDELAAAGTSEITSIKGNTHAELYAAFTDSVRCHMVADVPVGLFLSSGLDSAVLTALASEIQNTNIHTITLGFQEYQGTKNDETMLAPMIAEYYGARHQTHWITRTEFAHDLNRLFHAMDQPSIDGINSYFIAKAAKQAGFKAAISGVGGDELLGGYPSFDQVPRLVTALRGMDFGKCGRECAC
jgi:asparagine synthase (glutamine-hydrolysing)